MIKVNSMFEVVKVRRVTDRRIYQRRQEQFLEEYAGYCEPLQMHITPDGCKGVRSRKEPPEECKYCPGVDMKERRAAARRSGEDRREGW